MSETKPAEETVTFQVTRPRTLVFHPNGKRRYDPYQGPRVHPRTGERVEGDVLENVPRSIADNWVEDNVGFIVEDKKAEEESAPADETAEAPRRAGRPAKTTS